MGAWREFGIPDSLKTSCLSVRVRLRLPTKVIVMETHGENAFYDFVASGYDPDSVKDDDVNHVVQQWAIHLVPYFGVPTWDQQNMRRMQWPSLMAQLTYKLQRAHWALQQRFERQQEQMIELKKEISALKRAKK
jgi:hypothetical protein